MATARVAVMVMDADMHAGADTADMNAYADAGIGRRRAQKSRGKRRTDNRFHFESLIWLHNARVIPGARGTQG